MIPLTLPTDAQAVECALQTIGLVPPEQARVVQVSDTLHLSRTRVSEAFLDEVGRSDRLEQLGPLYDFPLDASGMLSDVPVE
jgi:hypothetical protein